MIADQLRALAEWIETETQLVRRDVERYVVLAAGVVVLRSLADKLQDKVVVRPETRTANNGVAWAWLHYTLAEAGTTEAEAIANLQATLDAAGRGDG